MKRQTIGFLAVSAVSMAMAMTQTSALAQLKSEVCPQKKDALKTLAESMKGISSGNSSNNPEMRADSIDYTKLDSVIGDRLNEMKQSEFQIQKLTVHVPDYKDAHQEFKRQAAQKVEFYLNSIEAIRANSMGVIKPFYSRIAALKKAADEDPTGVIKRSYDDEVSRLVESVKKLRSDNQEIYRHALDQLRFENVAFNAIPLEEAFHRQSLKWCMDTKTVNSRWGYTSYKIKTLCDRENKPIDILSGYYRDNRRFEASSSDTDDKQALIELKQRLAEGATFARREEGLQVSETGIPCTTASCARLIKRDIEGWSDYIKTLHNDLDFDHLIKAKTFWVSSDREVKTNMAASTALLTFAKDRLTSPVLPENQKTNLPTAGISLLRKVAELPVGLGAALAAAPAYGFDQLTRGVDEFSKLLGTDVVKLSLQIHAPGYNAGKIHDQIENEIEKMAVKLPAAEFKADDSNPFEENSCVANGTDHRLEIGPLSGKVDSSAQEANLAL